MTFSFDSHWFWFGIGVGTSVSVFWILWKTRILKDIVFLVCEFVAEYICVILIALAIGGGITGLYFGIEKVDAHVNKQNAEFIEKLHPEWKALYNDLSQVHNSAFRKSILEKTILGPESKMPSLSAAHADWLIRSWYLDRSTSTSNEDLALVEAITQCVSVNGVENEKETKIVQ